MRYIRFLKTPRIVHEKNTSRPQICCLITITSDLGDSFLPHDLTLSAELLDAETEEVIVWKTAQWTGGRTLPITFPLSKSRGARLLKLRVGVEPKSKCDEFSQLLDEDFRGTVSAWSAQFDPSAESNEAEKLVERRFDMGNEVQVNVWEETGESIARHLWDAGITLSCHLSKLLNENRFRVNSLEQLGTRKLRVVELGTGCGMVGITIAKLMQDTTVVLTDLAEAREIVEHNLEQNIKDRTKIKFQELDWEEDLPEHLQGRGTRCPHCAQIELVIAADCTYNSDSSPALVNTIHSIAKTSPHVTVAIAMKVRHFSEEGFFDLMSNCKFRTTNTIEYLLPGDENAGEETVHLYTYSYDGEGNRDTCPNQFCESYL
ncbi:hypothetical protein K458DRAFT_390059 [Lentithecium fluviatile CBS 122367]|uniref:Methyltransferase-domain-containing protein n=1 Tax=Lentithecium fluviatile CBS 122367 TaxID=1168545 RepID=A0A6G1IYW8_9PLEO|nr:hypothetical protein K458DRAFT_390059 [Lentithecium fluviatile CBS 122367]